MEHKKSPKQRGVLIVFEGLDRSGKTTQSKKLVETLNATGHPARWMSFPDRTTPIGTLIQDYLRHGSKMDDHAIHLLFCANRWERAAEIRSLLEAGTTLVIDRYSFSGAAYSASKGLDLKWCMEVERDLPAPDVVIFLEVHEDEATKRGGFGQEKYEAKGFQHKVKEQYAKLRQANWIVLQANRTPEKVQSDITAVIKRLMAQDRSALGVLDSRESESES